MKVNEIINEGESDKSQDLDYQARYKIIEARVLLLIKFPDIGYQIVGKKLQRDDTINKAIKINDFYIFYNPELMRRVDSNDVAELLKRYGEPIVTRKKIRKEIIYYWNLMESFLVSGIKTDYSFMRPVRNNRENRPKKDNFNYSFFCIAIDIGSDISNRDMKVFLNDIKNILKSHTGYYIRVFCFDTNIHNPVDYSSENIDSITDYSSAISTRGDTDPRCIFSWLNSGGMVPDRLMVLTEGHFAGSYGNPDYCETAWFIKDNPEFTPPFGVWASISGRVGSQ